jgi:hypothetical protein
LITNLSQLVLPESTILATSIISNLIPAHSHARVFAGHSVQTPQFDVRVGKAYQLIKGQLSTPSAQLFFHQNHLHYLFWGPAEQAVSGQEIPLYSPAILTPIFHSADGTTTLYQLKS